MSGREGTYIMTRGCYETRVCTTLMPQLSHLKYTHLQLCSFEVAVRET